MSRTPEHDHRQRCRGQKIRHAVLASPVNVSAGPCKVHDLPARHAGTQVTAAQSDVCVRVHLWRHLCGAVQGGVRARGPNACCARCAANIVADGCCPRHPSYAESPCHPVPVAACVFQDRKGSGTCMSIFGR
ncbi:hypothetical protein OH76DRAFT_638542 [Lentinus brumalis]|uniref:Uncharacterized protein n=1 Tax=Lentinus brumalis TaxID=2498619 RepID=A0A371D8Q0_9APHY|nr:hypothetical protein OH76DRAFT_638542 [Polyporus brumalis]